MVILGNAHARRAPFHRTDGSTAHVRRRNPTVVTERFFVITGSSGSGKSTLLGELGKLGYATVAEVGRAIVQEQVALGGRALPWVDHPAFMEEVLARNVRDHRSALSMRPPVFFDRAVPEVLCWARLLGIGVQPHHRAAVDRCRYHKKVFVTEPWPEIYATDSERRESYERSLESYQPTLAAYVEAGYELCVIPKVELEERVRFVLARSGSDD